MKRLLIALAITAAAVPFMQLLVLNPLEQNADFAFSDFYTRTAARMHPARLDTNIVVLSVDGLSRLEIAQAVEAADFFGAASVGLDVFMNGSTMDDDEVLAALSCSEHLVLPSSLTERFPNSLFLNLPDADYGYVNLESSVEGGIVRKYSTSRDGSRPFAAVVCGKDGPGGLIRFDGVDFEVITPDEMDPAGIQGKVVLVGNLNDFSDCHPTPLGTMPGVMIHAYTAHTILDDCTPKPLPGVLLLVIAFVIGSLLIWMHSCIVAANSGIAGLTMRMVQSALLVILYIVGAGLYAGSGRYADFSLVLLLVASAKVVYDLVNGAKTLVTPKKSKK